MDTFVRRTLVISSLLAVLFAASLQAAPVQTVDSASTDPHIRVLEPCRGSMVEDAARQSPTLQSLVDTLEGSDVIVYVRCVFFKDSTITGRLAFLGAVAGLRYVIVEVRFHEQPSSQVATLAHEMQHAVEVAQAPSIHDSETMAQHYRSIGTAVGRHPLIFETMAARAVAERVHRELSATSVRSRATDTSQ
jgi:hypothetical protein